MPGSGGAWYAKTGGAFAPGAWQAAQEIKEAAFEGLQDGAKEVLDVAKGRVPVLEPGDESQGRESGKLRDSARMQAFEETLRVGLMFGTPYAAYIHEHMDFKHPDGGQAKYLESAINDEREAVLKAIAERIKDVTGG